jgi:transposase
VNNRRIILLLMLAVEAVVRWVHRRSLPNSQANEEQVRRLKRKISASGFGQLLEGH